MKVHNYLRSRTKRSKKPQKEIIKLVLRIYNVNNYIVIVEKMAHYNVQSSTRVTNHVKKGLLVQLRTQAKKNNFYFFNNFWHYNTTDSSITRRTEIKILHLNTKTPT